MKNNIFRGLILLVPFLSLFSCGEEGKVSDSMFYFSGDVLCDGNSAKVVDCMTGIPLQVLKNDRFAELLDKYSELGASGETMPVFFEYEAKIVDSVKSDGEVEQFVSISKIIGLDATTGCLPSSKITKIYECTSDSIQKETLTVFEDYRFELKVELKTGSQVSTGSWGRLNRNSIRFIQKDSLGNELGTFFGSLEFGSGAISVDDRYFAPIMIEERD